MELRAVGSGEKPIDVVVKQFREEHATEEQYAFLLEEEESDAG